MFTLSLLGIAGVFAAGLVVGWNVLPQPAWAQALWAKLTKK